MSERVTIYILDNGIADVRMNRPDKLNALDPAMFEALVEAGKEVASNRSLRARPGLSSSASQKGREGWAPWRILNETPRSTNSSMGASIDRYLSPRRT